MNELIIIQYNMWKNKNKMMLIFLLKITWQKCKIIILQELWQNFYMNVIFCFNSSSFWSVYLWQHQNQACFLMNKKISISSWIVKHSRSDFSLLIFKLKNMMLHIHNIYLSLSRFLQNINKDFFIYSLQQLLSRSEEHLLVKNFNVHHSMWKETRCMKWHNITDNLI